MNIEKLKRDISWERGSFPSGACQYYYSTVISLQVYFVEGCKYTTENEFSTFSLLIFSYLLYSLILFLSSPYITSSPGQVRFAPFIIEIEWVFYPFYFSFELSSPTSVYPCWFCFPLFWITTTEEFFGFFVGFTVKNCFYLA